MNTSLTGYTLSYILVFAFMGIILLFLFRIIRAYFIPIDSPNRDAFLGTLKKVKIIVWLIFIALFVYRSFIENTWVTLAFLAIVFSVGWNYWRNLFSGVIMHLSSQFKIGDNIATDFESGELKKIGYTQSELLNDANELVIIPNFYLKSGILKHLNKKENAKVYTFNIASNAVRTRQEILKSALNCPFISSNQKIEVDTDDGKVFQVKASILDPSLMDKIETYFTRLS